MVPAWVTIHMLRESGALQRTFIVVPAVERRSGLLCVAGCKLPIELWIPISEFPTLELEAVLLKLGVTCRRLEGRDISSKVRAA